MTSFLARNRIHHSLIPSLLLLLLLLITSDVCSGHGISSCSSSVCGAHHNHHDDDGGGCNHHHHHHHHHHNHDHHQHHHHHRHHDDDDDVHEHSRKLPEELAEAEDMKLYGFSRYRYETDDAYLVSTISGPGLWVNAMGCSLLVSLASLICLIILPLVFVQGKPSKAVVDSLALFGAGAMLGDAFLHQLPHAFGGDHSHSHDHHSDHSHHGNAEQELGHSHAHSLEDLSVGLSILAGIVVFLLVEKVVRYVEANSNEGHGWGHGHHHHHSKSKKKQKDEHMNGNKDTLKGNTSKGSGKKEQEALGDTLNGNNSTHTRKRKNTPDRKDSGSDMNTADGSIDAAKSFNERKHMESQTNLVFGYLNLFSDGVHNFTDGMALGSAFLLYGSVGGWSRTLFLLAHELPQEIGDFGILVRSGFSVSKALFFNFLSALVALAGTALALLWGKDPGHSSLIEGFTAGGFIYIAVAGVLAEMNNCTPTLKNTSIQILSLVTGMSVALFISLVE